MTFDINPGVKKKKKEKQKKKKASVLCCPYMTFTETNRCIVQKSDVNLDTQLKLEFVLCVGPLRPCWWGADYRATTHAAWLQAICPHGTEKSTAPQAGRTSQQHSSLWGLIFQPKMGAWAFYDLGCVHLSSICH